MQLPARLARELAGEIPERQIERPAAAPMEADVVEDAPVALDLQRILADEQGLVTLEPKHHVAGAVAGDAEVGVNGDDRSVPEGARLGVPARVERRIEMQSMPGDLDAGDNGLQRVRRRKEGFGHDGHPSLRVSAPWATADSSSPRRPSSIVGPDGLEVHGLVDCVRRAIAPETGLLEAAERGR